MFTQGPSSAWKVESPQPQRWQSRCVRRWGEGRQVYHRRISRCVRRWGGKERLFNPRCLSRKCCRMLQMLQTRPLSVSTPRFVHPIPLPFRIVLSHASFLDSQRHFRPLPLLMVEYSLSRPLSLSLSLSFFLSISLSLSPLLSALAQSSPSTTPLPPSPPAGRGSQRRPRGSSLRAPRHPRPRLRIPASRARSREARGKGRAR